ncbi:uncharacterized protein LOC134276121 [Saccostrea cucullata]|uniref:uncharacterized protein LOC134276121 n=1 Tax=Saccostrea cuccullata TaxID=36930 RepID=UPI002ED5324A
MLCKQRGCHFYSERRHNQGRGPCNVFILDTSSNMGQDGPIQMKDTFCTIMDEYARYSEMDENVAVVICGRATTFIHYYSNNYDQIKHCIDDVEYGGPCPLTAAFILSLGGVLKRAGHTRVMGRFYVHPRFIVISAGRPTDFTLVNHMEEVEDIFEICTKMSLFKPMDQSEEESINSKKDMNSLIEWDPRMPPLGSRVRRSPGGHLGTMERHIIGTVIEHSKDVGWLIVHWDGDSVDKCRYGSSIEQEYKYDVIVCDVPRILENELIATGCLVYRGPDWKYGDQDGGQGSSVYKASPNGIVEVRWQNGSKNNYRFGFGGEFDLSIYEPFSADANRFLEDQQRCASSKLPETMQNIYTEIPTADTQRSGKEILKIESETNVETFLKTSKGTYFKNDRVETDDESDLDLDYSDVTVPSLYCDHWLWKDNNGIWNHYSRRINEKLMKNFKRNPTSTVVITLNDDFYVHPYDRMFALYYLY